MADELTVSDRFRQTLKRQLALWRREGIVSPEQADLLAGRYRLEALGREGGNRLIFAIYMIGAALIACGVVSFVAWHWEGMAVGVKIALIVTTMLASHATGFYLWKVRPGHEKLGHALVTLGTLIFGANIGLMAQIFHVHSNWYNGVGAWALGAAAVACAVGSVPNALIALAASFLWWWGGSETRFFHSNGPEFLWQFSYYPLLVAAVFTPLAYSKRSAILFAPTMLAIGFSALCVAGEQGGVLAGGITSLALAAMLIGLARAAGGARAAIAAVSRMLACLAVGIAAYIYSFRGVVGEMGQMHWQRGVGQVPWALLVALAVLVGIVAFAYGRATARRPAFSAPFILGLGAGGLVVLTMCAGCVGASNGSHRYDDSNVPAILLANLALVLLAAAMVWHGVVDVRRGAFWAGVLLVALQIASRFLEYETGLMGKAVVCLACGVGIIVCGVRFESYLKARRPADA